MDLLFDPSKSQRPRRVCIFGGPGVGKSSWMRSAPGLIETPTEDAACTVPSQAFPVAKSYDQLCQYLKAVRTETHSFQTLGVDSLTMVEKLIRAELCESDGVKSIELVQKGYGKGFTMAAEVFAGFLNGLEMIQLQRNMSIVLIAHARVEKQDDPGVDSYGKHVMSMHEKITKATVEWCDEVFFARSVVYTSKEKEGFKTTTKATSADERVLFTTDKPSHIGKNRLDMPERIPMLKVNGWDEYRKFHPATLTKAE